MSSAYPPPTAQRAKWCPVPGPIVCGLAAIALASCAQAPHDTCKVPALAAARTAASLNAAEVKDALTQRDEELADSAQALAATPQPGFRRNLAELDAMAAEKWRKDPSGEYVNRINIQSRHDYCLRSKAYEARHVDADLEATAKGIIIQCDDDQTNDADQALALVLSFRACGSGG